VLPRAERSMPSFGSRTYRREDLERDSIKADSEGQFTFSARRNSPEISIAARADGYMDGSIGQMWPDAPTIPLNISRAGADIQVELRLWKPVRHR
jgi:hypothetical protein